jgi:DNA processing protein
MDLTQLIALTLIPKAGSRKIKTLLQEMEVDDFFRASKHRLKSIPGIGEKFLIELDRTKALQKAEQYLSYFEQHTIEPIFYQNDAYPMRLKQCDDAPIMLYRKGDMHYNSEKVIAIVGTRNATTYGKKCCDELLEGLVGKNIVVVSGLAYGIDIYAHQRCLELGIETIGVLGHGLDRIYPAAHTSVARKMIEKGGLLSEFLPGTKPDRENFPMRNRIVAGMCDATIVVESGEKGGSLITAELANDYARDVFAYPGDIEKAYSKGCNYLIQKQKAHLITSCNDFLNFMNWNDENAKQVKQPKLFFNLTEEEACIVKTIQEKTEISLDVLALKTEIGLGKLNGILLKLELEGVIKMLPGKRYLMEN